MSVLKYWSGKIFAPILPKLSVPTGLNRKYLSRISEIIEMHEQDLLVHHKISLRTASTLLNLGKEIRNTQKPYIPTNVLICHGDADRITCFQASKEFFDRLRVKDGCNKEHLWISGGYHELHFDLCADQVIQKHIDWIKSYSTE